MNDILDRAITQYGKQPQMIVAIEELSELQKEICKHLRGSDNRDHMAEEIADVEIMLEQLKKMMDLHWMVGDWKGIKLARLKKRLEEQDADVSGV